MSKVVIPDDWKIVPLEQVAILQTGLAKGKTNIKNPVRKPYLRVANVQDGHLDLSEIKEIEVSEDEIPRYLLKAGDVLLTEGGDNDKLGRGTVWRGEVPDCLHQNHVFVVRPNADILNPQFLSLLTGSSYGKFYFRKSAKQSTNLASINSTQIKAFPVLLPNIREQHRIVEILSTWNEAITKTERLIAALRERKKGLMQRLLTGQTRFPGFEDEPKDNHLRTVKISTEGILPENWVVTFLGDVTYESRDRAAPSKKENLPVLGVNNVTGIDTSPKYFADDLSRYKIIKPGMFAYNPMRLNIGSIGYCTPKIEEGLVSPDYVVFGCKDQLISSDFLYYCIQSHEWKSWMNKAGNGSVRIRIYYDDISQYTIKLPPIKEQRKIAEVLSMADQEITHREQYLHSLQQQKKGLMQRLLTGEVRVKV